jgi:hypothetical protein
MALEADAAPVTAFGKAPLGEMLEIVHAASALHRVFGPAARSAAIVEIEDYGGLDKG